MFPDQSGLRRVKTTVFLWFRRACMHGWTGLFALLIFGCSADLRIPEGIILACDNDSDCPSGARCTLTGSGDESVCVTDGLPTCGNGVLEANETCDDGQDNATGYGAPNRCNTTCDGYAPHCGDSLVNGGEDCDLGDANSDAYGDSTGCNTACSGPSPHCGDAVINGGESCDDGMLNSNQYGTPGRCTRCVSTQSRLSHT